MRELKDVEMVALAALANCWATHVAAANQDRANQGKSPAYDTCDCEEADLLRVELHRRGVLA